MGELTEREIIDCLATHFRLAAEDARSLATLPLKGPTYDSFRKKLRMIEGACRQMSAWREDTRWLPIGRMMAEVHQKAGGWLRGYKRDDGVRVSFPAGQQNHLFGMLAAKLEQLHKVAEGLRTKATGKVGMILPVALPGPHRDTVPVGWRQSSAGLLMPQAGHA